MTDVREVIIIGGGLAGLSAALYLGRSRRDTLLIHSGRSMAKWEVQVQNYLGFPDGIAGTDLLERGMEQAMRVEVELVEDEVQAAMTNGETFHVQGRQGSYDAKRMLISTGLTHLPPDIPGVKECLGKSLFFCKDCDAYRLQGQRVGIIGQNNEAVDYALGMLLFTPSIMVATNGREAQWDHDHAGWLEEYQIPVRQDGILALDHDEGRLRTLRFTRGEPVQMDALFTTRGDTPHSALATGLGALVDTEGQIVVDERLSTNVPGLYAAGCVTPANCQMIIAAGQGAIAAQAINRDLFEESLRRHTLPRFEGQTYGSKKSERKSVETQPS